MAPALISQPVLPAKPAADCNAYIFGLLTELRQKIDDIPVMPGQNVTLDSNAVHGLRGVSSELSVALRNLLKWAA